LHARAAKINLPPRRAKVEALYARPSVYNSIVPKYLCARARTQTRWRSVSPSRARTFATGRERERADAEGIWLWALSPPPLLLGESAIPAAAAALNGRFIKKIRRLSLVLLGL
jgi:hypothetical protein